MTLEIGDTTFSGLMYELRQQVGLLKRRCISAETELAILKEANEAQEHKILQLQKANQELTDKYNNLQVGATPGQSTEEIENLRNRYLAMIREIDLCLSKLNG